MMKIEKVNINSELLFQTLGEYMERFVREKAIKAGSTIVYKEDRFLIEENPTTGEKRILKEYFDKLEF